MFDFKNISVDRPSFIGYGVHNDVTIVGVESGNSQAGTAFVQLTVKKTGDDDKNATILKMYFTAKSQLISMRKVVNIHSAVAKLDILQNKSFASSVELATALDAMWKNKRLRLKLQGSEYITQNEQGEDIVKTRTEIPLNNFVEAIMEGAEKPVVSNDDTKLTFNDKDKWDFRRLSEEDKAGVETTTDSTKEETTGDDGLPF